MLSLVNYGSDSDMSDDDVVQDVKVTETSADAVKSSNSVGIRSDVESTPSTSSSSLTFAKIPEPQAVTTHVETDETDPLPPKKVDYGDELEKPPGIEFKHLSLTNLRAQRVGGKMLISAPSLKDFENEDDDEGVKKNKILRPAAKKSGLFSILPEPKHSDYVFAKPSQAKVVEDEELESSDSVDSSSFKKHEKDMEKPQKSGPSKSNTAFVPHVVQQSILGKRPTPSKLDEIRSKYLKQEMNVEIVSRKKQGNKDSDDEDGSDFFSFAAASEQVPEDPSLRIPEYQPPPPDVDMSEPTDEPSHYYVADTAGSSSAEDVLRYIPQGKKAKKESINFIDVSADDLRPDSTEWVKNITAEDPAPRRSRDAPGGLTKRKHQITYLAFEAKEREQSLKAQWAQNRHNKRMTQSKYGF